MAKALVLALIALSLQAEGPLVWHKSQSAPEYVELRAGGAPILRYNYGTQLPPGVPEDRARCCYVYPLWTPRGVSLLDDFPKDHYHHRGLFWAWPDVRVGSATYDGWLLRGLRTVNKHLDSEVRAGGRIATLNVRNEWLAGGKTIATAVERYTIHASKGSGTTLEVALTLTATDAPVTLRGSHESGKSYGGLSLRFAPRSETVIRTDKGVSENDEDLTTHPWAELEGTYDGRKAALRVRNDARNDGGSPQWCLRHYGFVGAAFPGKTKDRDSFTLEPGSPLTLRYSILVADR